MKHSFYHTGARSKDRHAAPQGTRPKDEPTRPSARELLAPMLFLAFIVAVVCIICAMLLQQAVEWPLQE